MTRTVVRGPRHSQRFFPGALVLAVLGGCSDHGPTGPGSSSTCGGTLVSLGVLESVTLDCSSGGTTLTLAGNGASYLVVPQFAAGGVPNQAVGYTIGVSAGSAVTASVYRGPPGPEPTGGPTLGASAQKQPRVIPGLLQRQFDGMLRAADRAALATGGRQAPASVRQSVSRTPALSVQPPLSGASTTSMWSPPWIR